MLLVVKLCHNTILVADVVIIVSDRTWGDEVLNALKDAVGEVVYRQRQVTQSDLTGWQSWHVRVFFTHVHEAFPAKDRAQKILNAVECVVEDVVHWHRQVRQTWHAEIITCLFVVHVCYLHTVFSPIP